MARVPTLAGYLRRELVYYQRAIAEVYRKLSAWLPEPVTSRIEQCISALRDTGQSSERIAEIVRQARIPDGLEVPGTAIDRVDFIKSANYLAHVQWALEHDKSQALEHLAGKQAARNYRHSKGGNKAQFVERLKKLPAGHPLKGAPTVEKRNELIREQARTLR